MDLKKIKIKQIIKLIYRTLVGHIGANGDEVHGSANEYTSGFMSVGHVKNLKEAKGVRTWVTKVDIFSLPAGYYEGNQLINTPDVNAIYEVDIKEGANKRKQITLVESGTGRIIYRNFHTNGESGNSPSAWTKIKREVTLWSGSEYKVGSKLYCIQNPRIYSSLRVEIDLNGSGVSQTFIIGILNNKLYAIQGINLSNTATSSLFEIFEINLALPSGEIYFEIMNNRKVSYSPDGPVVQQSGLGTVTGIYGIQ